MGQLISERQFEPEGSSWIHIVRPWLKKFPVFTGLALSQVDMTSSSVQSRPYPLRVLVWHRILG